MAVLNLDYYENEDRYSDGDIEEKLLSYVKGQLTEEQLEDGAYMYPVLYHLSALRENILNWYPFSRDCSVLEIGAGCGALTGLLCKKAGSVVAVELSKRRAAINYERHKEFENLEIMVGNFNQMAFPGQFDYVILNGVLEYAISFTDGETPYETFLSLIGKLIKPQGHLLIAIENRLGLKYFNGAPEDHTGHYFEGVNGYQNNDSVRTFSREELTALLKSCGFTAQRFYYPYPDYKFPAEIFTDETIHTYGYGKPFVNLSGSRYRIFEEQGVWQAFAREKITASFANSFLVDASPERTDGQILYAKLNNDRADAFRIATTIERRGEETVVVKRPLTEEAAGHLRNMARCGGLTPDPTFRNLEGELLKDGSICYPFLRSKTLDSLLEEMMEKGETGRIVSTLHKVFDQYGKNTRALSDYHTPEFEERFGKASLEEDLVCVRPANIDLICDNIFMEEEGCRVIDCEWVFDMPIPMAFIIWRSLNELYTKHPVLGKLIPRQRLMLEFDIDDKMSGVFWQWATYFAKEYVGSSRLEQHTRFMEFLSLDDVIRQKRQEKMLCSSLYYDLGQGFSEEQKLYSEVDLTEEGFSVTYDLEKLRDVRQLRWDPLEGSACICSLTKVEGACARALNADIKEPGRDIFLTTDPNYILETDEMPARLTIEGTIHRMDGRELAAYIQDRLPLLEWDGNLRETLQNQKEQIGDLKDRLSRAEAAAAQTASEKNMLEQQQTRLTDDYNRLRQEYDRAVQELEEIHASRSWRFLNKLKGK